MISHLQSSVCIKSLVCFGRLLPETSFFWSVHMADEKSRILCNHEYRKHLNSFHLQRIWHIWGHFFPWAVSFFLLFQSKQQHVPVKFDSGIIVLVEDTHYLRHYFWYTVIKAQIIVGQPEHQIHDTSYSWFVSWMRNEIRFINQYDIFWLNTNCL